VRTMSVQALQHGRMAAPTRHSSPVALANHRVVCHSRSGALRSRLGQASRAPRPLAARPPPPRRCSLLPVRAELLQTQEQPTSWWQRLIPGSPSQKAVLDEEVIRQVTEVRARSSHGFGQRAVTTL
jgi:hypothetical protein